MHKLIHLTSNYPLKNQDVYIRYDIIQTITRHESHECSHGKTIPSSTCISTRNFGQFLVNEMPHEVHQLIQDKADFREIRRIGALNEALQPFADLLSDSDIEKISGQKEITITIDVQMIRDAKAALE